MSKTYSIAILSSKNKTWVTNYAQYANLNDINWDEVEKHCLESGHYAYGYYYGHNSRNLTSKRCRSVLKVLDQENFDKLEKMK